MQREGSVVCAEDSLLRGKAGGSMQEKRAVGPGREGLPRVERRRERLGVGTGDLSTPVTPGEELGLGNGDGG